MVGESGFRVGRDIPLSGRASSAFRRASSAFRFGADWEAVSGPGLTALARAHLAPHSPLLSVFGNDSRHVTGTLGT